MTYTALRHYLLVVLRWGPLATRLHLSRLYGREVMR